LDSRVRVAIILFMNLGAITQIPYYKLHAGSRSNQKGFAGQCQHDRSFRTFPTSRTVRTWLDLCFSA
jgi:hypothetical protein